MNNLVKKMEENSIPLIVGVIAGLLAFNYIPAYGNFLHSPVGKSIEFIINDIFMVLFFGLATIEIVAQTRKGGSLENVQEAGNPLIATLGGVIVPAGIYLIANYLLDAGIGNGFVIPCATDIAIAWLVSKAIFKSDHHPMVGFILLLAIADDLIGMILIAAVYNTGGHTIYLILVAVAMLVTWSMKKKEVQNLFLYIIPTMLAWFGLHESGLHASLALLCIIPFMPWSSIQKLEHIIKSPVTWGLAAFGIVNMAIPLNSFNEASVVVTTAYIVGKPLGIIGFSLIASYFGVKADERISKMDLIKGGFICAIGLTVASFVAGIALIGVDQQGAKFGALLVTPIIIGALFLISFFEKKLLTNR